MSLTLFALFKLFQLGTPHAGKAQPQLGSTSTHASIQAPLNEDAPSIETAVSKGDPVNTKRMQPRGLSTLSLHRARPLTAFQVQAWEGALGKPMHERTLARPAHKRLASHLMGNSTSTQSIALPTPEPTQKTLRVLRVLDSGVARHQAGRMVMSGSMRDVCAELDRLAAF